jgi:hypothetical protein
VWVRAWRPQLKRGSLGRCKRGLSRSNRGIMTAQWLNVLASPLHRTPASALPMILLLCACPVAAPAQVATLPAADDTSRTAIEAWLLTELPKLHVHYGNPIPPFDRSGSARGRLGDQPTSPAYVLPPTDERIARVKLDGCRLQIEQRFEGSRIDPVGVISTVPLDQIDSTGIQVESRPRGSYARSLWPVVTVRAASPMLEMEWVRADSRHEYRRAAGVPLAMPDLSTAEAVATRLRRAVGSCRGS